MYKENRLVEGRCGCADERVDLRKIDQNMLVVTAGADHIAPAPGHAAAARPGLAART